MSSIWLAADAVPSKALKRSLRCRSKSSRVPSSYLGVFTDDPAVIGQWLPRPTTPFVPAEPLSFFKHQDYGEGLAEIVSDSPSTDGLFDFSHPKLQGMEVGIPVF
jgi:hypothetical protein